MECVDLGKEVGVGRGRRGGARLFPKQSTSLLLKKSGEWHWKRKERQERREIERKREREREREDNDKRERERERGIEGMSALDLMVLKLGDPCSVLRGAGFCNRHRARRRSKRQCEPTGAPRRRPG